jgi:hypothetical protein
MIKCGEWVAALHDGIWGWAYQHDWTRFSNSLGFSTAIAAVNHVFGPDENVDLQR